MKYHIKMLSIYFFSIVTSGLVFSSGVQAKSPPMVSDSQIISAVNVRLSSDPATASSGINVNAKDGVVTLTGRVKTSQEVDSAVENAESVNGVSDVNSEIVVTDSTQPGTDTLITAKVKGLYIRENLFGNNKVSITDIHVETKDGVVYLSGKAVKVQADNAQMLAKSVAGVVGVTSHIRILND